ncbi:MAG TPA: prepilin-type N-terminal cleavage/methylation domain-containing protein [Burkholderiaceae bacterium]|nr:prepilin-type N-terminal cleavage/methylation domain-containing protein [Burkholderiaceae bacterium]
MHKTLRLSRGVSLVEAMVALAVMAFGMLAVVGVQSTLRLNGDIAKQRSEATRLAQERLDTLRSFTSIDGAGGYNEIVANAGPTPVNDLVTNTTFNVQSEVVTYADPPARALRVTVGWTDRAGGAQQVVMASAIAAAAPALSGTLAVRPGIAAVAPVRRPLKRHPTIPVLARDLGGSSAFVLPFRPWTVLVFNNVTGVVTGICNLNYDTSNDTVTSSDIDSCANTMTGQLLTGFVRFQPKTSGGDLIAADVENPPGPALNLRMRLTLTSSGHPQGPTCFDDATSYSVSDGSQQYAQYFCVVYSNSAGTWSGISTVEARSGFGSPLWVISDTQDPSPGAADAYRICRYTVATSDTQTVSNQDHPRNYADVSGNLVNQNFVAIRAVKHCPADGPADPANGDLVNSNTLQHQPTPS